jgi:hypothetical protein
VKAALSSVKSTSPFDARLSAVALKALINLLEDNEGDMFADDANVVSGKCENGGTEKNQDLPGIIWYRAGTSS